MESLVFPTFATCPECTGPVRGESLEGLMVFVCVVCGSTWHIELGIVYRVDSPGAEGGSWSVPAGG